MRGDSGRPTRWWRVADRWGGLVVSSRAERGIGPPCITLMSQPIPRSARDDPSATGCHPSRSAAHPTRLACHARRAIAFAACPTAVRPTPITPLTRDRLLPPVIAGLVMWSVAATRTMAAVARRAGIAGAGRAPAAAAAGLLARRCCRPSSGSACASRSGGRPCSARIPVHVAAAAAAAALYAETLVLVMSVAAGHRAGVGSAPCRLGRAIPVRAARLQLHPELGPTCTSTSPALREREVA